jgi:hypothetical protein
VDSILNTHPGIYRPAENSYKHRTFLIQGSLKRKLNSVPWVHERTIPTERLLLLAKLVPTFADRGCHVVNVTNPYGRILGFLDWSRYVFFQVAPQLYSRGWVDPVSDPLLLRKCGSAGNRTRNSGSVARNSDHWTTEAVYFLLHIINSVRTSHETHYISVV